MILPRRSALRPRILAALAGACLSVGLGACQTKGDHLAELLQPSIQEAALRAEAGHDYAAAAGYYQSLYEMQPSEERLALAFARNMRYAGQAQGSMELLLGHLSRNKPTSPLLLELGKSQVAADRAKAAIETFRAALALEAGWEAHSGMGIAYDYLNMATQAQESYQAALAISPDNPVVLNNLALSLAQGGDIGTAVVLLERAVLQPRAGAQIRQNLALLTAFSGDPDYAERMARQDLPQDMADYNSAIFKVIARQSRLNAN